MHIESLLKQIDLNSSEIKVYIYLLEQGLSTPPQVAKGTGIARPHCYGLLRSLKDAGLITSQPKGKRLAFVAHDPQALLNTLERKKQAVADILPDLRALYTTQKNKPKITFYENWTEVQQIYQQTLSAKAVYGIASTPELFKFDEKFYSQYMADLAKRGVMLYDITSGLGSEDTSLKMKGLAKAFYNAKILPNKYGSLYTDILIWNDKIALISLKEPIFGTVLQNAEIARTFQVLFKVLWDSLSSSDL